MSGKLKKDLQYQADEQFMMHDTAILALNFSRDSELLVSGSQDGKLKVKHKYNEPWADPTSTMTQRFDSLLSHGLPI